MSNITRIAEKMSSTEQDNAGVIAPPPLIYFVPLLLTSLLHRLRPLPLLPRTLARSIGGILTGAVVVGQVWFILTMRRNKTPFDPRQSVQKIVTTGPFRFSRNPSYTMFAILYVGIASLINTFWPIFALPIVLFVIQRGVIEREERYLERKFGKEYKDYKNRVRRWL